MAEGLDFALGDMADAIRDTTQRFAADRLATITVVFLLFIYALVIVACLKLRGQDEENPFYRANTPLLLVGLVGNVAILGFTIYDDPHSLIWCAGLLGVGLVLFLAEYFFGSRGTGSEAPDLKEV